MLRAKFQGQCGRCGTDIFTGEVIKRHENGWCHSNCVPGPGHDGSEYAAGRAQGAMESAERKIYGRQLADQFHMNDDLARYNAGEDY